MAITTLESGGSATSTQSFNWTIDYDSTAQAIGLTCSGVGHAELTLIVVATSQVLGAAWCDQFGTTSGTLAGAGSHNVAGVPNAGESDQQVTYDGTRHIVVGPGAVGINAAGNPLSTTPVPSSVVGAFDLKNPTLQLYLTWAPN